MSTVVVERCDAPLGAVVRGLPLDPVTDQGMEQIRALLREHLVVALKPADGPLDDDALLTIARGLGGTLADHDRWGLVIPLIGQPDEQGRPQGVGTPSKPLEWHTDYSYEQRPGKETLLHAVTLSSDGGSTSFIDMYRAFATLPAELEAYVRSHRATHTTGVYPDHPEHEELGSRDVEHPMAFPHPETGRVALYVNPLLTKAVVGVDPQESAQVLAALYEHAIDKAVVYEHVWEVGDLVVFDAIGTIHRREPYGGTGIRHLREISTLV